MNEEYLAELVKYITKKKPTKKSLNSFKVRLCKKHKLGKIPKDIDILLALSPKDLKRVKKYLITKPVRSLSGVTVVAMMAAPRKCAHGTCTFCPGGPGSVFGDVPQSYTGKEPSTMRALRNKFDSYYIMMNRLEQYICAGHLPDKVEIIIQGGTFPSYPRKYQRDYVTYALKALNDFSRIFFPKKLKGEIDFAKFKKFFALPGDIYDKKREALLFKRWKKIRGKSTLEREQLRNEKARLKCVGLTIETNPQYARLAHGNMMLSLGCTRVELGVQTLYDKVLRKTNRGHGLQGTIEAIHILRDLGFKLNFHMMLGLPGVTKSMDLRALIKLFHDEDYRPDMLKIYPCMVMPGTKLFKEWKKGKFKPINTKQSAELIARFKEYCPEYCRIM
ncbi:MAG: tRNA uridine(34) 5-carboxymethylaminomethyl modification radical SAM/GNAT enzyme Elp3, partial [Candidatus Woesearchaeota archaeon]|nr:tRNA uridine(34) 5-carboxymethylaminomethyl modification radical SAM/GNAT enzyme Elp3 [Candidatus Woesearchaeota archaeon]